MVTAEINSAREYFEHEVRQTGDAIQSFYTGLETEFPGYDRSLRRFATDTLFDEASIAREEIFSVESEDRAKDLTAESIIQIDDRLGKIIQDIGPLIDNSLPDRSKFRDNAFLFVRGIALCATRITTGVVFVKFCAGFMERVPFDIQNPDSSLAFAGACFGTYLMVKGILGMLDRLQSPLSEGRILPQPFKFSELFDLSPPKPVRPAAILRDHAKNLPAQGQTFYNIICAFLTDPQSELKAGRK